MNSFGRIFQVTSFGESHGPAIGCVVDGCPSGLQLTKEDIQRELDRRKPGQGPLSTERKESDEAELLSGVFEGRTLGTPIALVIRNQDTDSKSYEKIRDLPRPGHADYTWREKFGWVDFRGGGRASGRETACRVAAGAVAKKLLSRFGVEAVAYTTQIAGVKAADLAVSDVSAARERIDASPVKALDPEKEEAMVEAVLSAKKEKDSVGGVIEAVVSGLPAGIGEPVFDKLDADLAKAVLSIPGVKGVEFGAGFQAAEMRGSAANDPFFLEGGKVKTKTNNAGGILGGISTGMPVVLRAAVKPTSSIGVRQKTVDLSKMEDAEIEVGGRHDPCIVPRAVAVVEAMMALALADHMLLSGFIPRKLV